LSARGRALAFVVVFVAMLTLAPSAFAHARLIGSQPADGAELRQGPASVSFVFDDTITPGSRVAAIRDGGGSALGGKAVAVGDGKRTLVVPLRKKLTRGDYSVRWAVVSDDGHPISGVIAFSVGTGKPPVAAVLRAGSSSPSSLELVARWLFFAGLLVGGGGALFRRLVWRPALAATQLSAQDSDRLDGRSQRATAALLASSCYLVTLGAAIAIAATPGSSLTRFGRWMEAGMALAAAAVALGLVAAALKSGRRLLTLVSIAVPCLLVVPSLSGHAFDPRHLRPLTFLVDVLHVGAAAVWVGGLVQLAVVVPRVAKPLLRDTRTALYADLFRRFSRIAFVSVPVLVLTGVVRSLFELSAVSEMWTTSYGKTLLVKIGLLLVLLVFGWVNRYRLVPRLSTPAKSEQSVRTTVGRLRVAVGSEIVLLAVVVAAVALLTGLKPARFAANGTPPTLTSQVGK
jgi:copper transport protein